MNCPRCGAASKVLQTREGLHLSTLRRRECERGHRFSTNEIYDTWFKHNQSRIGAAAKAMAVRVARWLVRDRIAHDPRPSSVIARELGYHRDSVKNIKRTHI